MGNCPSGELSVWGIVRVGNCPVGNCPSGELSEWGIVLVGNCPVGNCPFTTTVPTGGSSSPALEETWAQDVYKVGDSRIL